MAAPVPTVSTVPPADALPPPPNAGIAWVAQFGMHRPRSEFTQALVVATAIVRMMQREGVRATRYDLADEINERLLQISEGLQGPRALPFYTTVQTQFDFVVSHLEERGILVEYADDDDSLE